MISMKFKCDKFNFLSHVWSLVSWGIGNYKNKGAGRNRFRPYVFIQCEKCKTETKMWK